jgi:hypothetical protein
MSDQQNENIRSYREMVARRNKRKFTDAEIKEIERIAKDNPEALGSIPSYQAVINLVSQYEADLMAARESGTYNAAVNAQYAGHTRSIGKAAIATEVMADSEIATAVVAGGGMRGAYKVCPGPRCSSSASSACSSSLPSITLRPLPTSQPRFWADMEGCPTAS